MKTSLIAEIGSNHFGDINLFKEMVKQAKDSGADLVKSQAYKVNDVYKLGSMQMSFYKQCELTLGQYIDLIYWAKQVVDIDLFYSIFSDELLEIMMHQQYHKLSHNQFNYNNLEQLEFDERTFMSFSDCDIINFEYSEFKKIYSNIEDSNILYVSNYLADGINLISYKKLKIIFNGKDIGYSDHTIGIRSCINAFKNLNVPVIEKHFVSEDSRNTKYNGRLFRDTVHAADPREFYRLAKKIK